MSKAETALKEQDNDEAHIIDGDAGNDAGTEIDDDRAALMGMDRQIEGDEGEGSEEADDDSEGDDAEAEFEIVRDGADGSHPKQDENRGFRKRIGKLNAKAKAAQEGKTEAEEALEVERERTRLLQLALDQKSGEGRKDDGKPPNPDDFDGGVADPKFVEALQDHVEAKAIAKIQASQSQSQTEQKAQSRLYDRQVEHYKRADKLNVPDYDDTEDKAIAVLGQDIVNQFIANSDKSEVVLYWLGKNPDDAEQLRTAIERNPVKGVLELGRLEATLSARPKSKSKPAPDPDGEQRGGGGGEKKTRRGPPGAKFE